MKRSKFSLSHNTLLTGYMGKLIPLTWFEVLPGDSVFGATHALLRTLPLMAPVMHACDVRVHWWFVPNRLVWTNWERFITGGPDGMDATQHPYIFLSGNLASQKGGLLDYLGVKPTNFGAGVKACSLALAVRAYQKIWSESYRDQDLEAPANILTTDGLDASTAWTLQNCAWEKDFYTGARPWLQKGPDISIPLGSTAPVELAPGTQSMRVRTGNGMYVDRGAKLVTAGGGSTELDGELQTDATGHGVVIDPAGRLQANLAGAVAASANSFREAFGLLRYEEARALYGSRYTEYLRYLGVQSSDARLQRPEYLGGGKSVISFSEVLQSTPAEGEDQTGVGSMYGHGIGATHTNSWLRYFEEHGIVMCLMSVRPKTVYADAAPRGWFRETKEHYWQRELEHIGQQEVLNGEVYQGSPTPYETFGYTPRYDEYRHMESRVCGDFRDKLKHYHLARFFAAQPVLNQSFVSCDPRTDIFQLTATPPLWVSAHHSIHARRMLSQRGTPGMSRL